MHGQKNIKLCYINVAPKLDKFRSIYMKFK
jgi:hypothetical protein